MEKKRVDFEDKYFSACSVFLVLIACCITIATVFKKIELVSLLFSLSFVVIFLFASVRIICEKKAKLVPSILIVVSVLNIILGLLLVPYATVNFDYFKKVMMFVAFIFFLNYAKDYSISGKAYSYIQTIPVITGGVLLVSYYFGGNVDTYARGITLGFSNPNFTGMWLLHFFLYTFLYLIESKKNIYLRIGLFLLLYIYIHMISLTLARSCIIGIIIFFILLLTKRIFKTYNRVMLWTVVIFPIIFVLLYILWANQTWFVDLFSVMETEGKTLTSRLSIWKAALEQYKSNPILGSYYAISGGTGQSQMHNTHLDVLCSYGLVPLILFCKNLFDVSRSACQSGGSFYNDAALCAFITIILTGIFEAAIVSGAMGLNLLTVGLLLLSKRNNWVD